MDPKNQVFWFNTFTRLDPIGLGILLALLLHTKRVRPNGWERIFLLCASLVILLVVSWYCHLNWLTAPVSGLGLLGYPMAALSCCGIVLATVGTNLPITRNAALIYLGKISYGLYVYHLLGMWMIDRLSAHLHRSYDPFAYAVAGLGLTIVLASTSYHFLELPFLQFKKRFTYVLSRPV
jgi:peptidoglycan/LPS O-acetylase OafA/YrhL